MKITVISYDNWGLNSHLINALIQKGHTVHHINFFDFKYKYPNIQSKIYNFILKTVSNKNIKNIYYGDEILKKLKENNEVQDLILTIKGDFIGPKAIFEFKKYTKKSIAFFNDSITRCPKIKHVIPNFDEVYSFEKDDCEKHSLKFLTNWIYPIPNSGTRNKEYQVFNISSKDKRFSLIVKIASILKEKKINYKIIIFDKKNKSHNSSVEYISKQIQLSEVNDYLHNTQVLLDINRVGQKGLTFRVFESLGLEKKLITTNADIKNYDFYNPNNILIIDEKKPNIPLDFFSNKYQKIPKDLFEKYSIEEWINQITN
ncbi:hypothetical protein [Flavobacterium sp. M31R6]|uniref:hypothetical protein n=1 Tax=Flavobacterium sp. M31R6 TaxID=2739062 RepID=UPI001569D195|nr:hypothetical protein [Flavobacterium sp. M31R6]QKJ64404.1 hypothetical protein HQN62_15105 [Flavobacterium sp. M31R6]